MPEFPTDPAAYQVRILRESARAGRYVARGEADPIVAVAVVVTATGEALHTAESPDAIAALLNDARARRRYAPDMVPYDEDLIVAALEIEGVADSPAAELAAALAALLDCAELSQDDLEDETRDLIDAAHDALDKWRGR